MKEWIFKNNNQKFIAAFARRSLRSGRFRTALALLTIALAAALISGMAMFVMNFKKAEGRQLDSMQQVLYMNLNENQCRALKADNRVSQARILKSGISSEINGLTISPVYVEEKDSEIAGPRITEGRYPEDWNEIVIDKAYFSRIGKEAGVGTKVTFRYYNGEEESFRVSGFTDTGTTGRRFPVYFSKTYAEKGSQLKDSSYTLAVKLDGAESMSETEFLENITELGADYGIKRGDINENNKFVTSLVMNMTELLLVAAAAVFILFAGAIVVYSIFYISVAGRIRQFGQLRTLGASPKQLSGLVKTEGRILFVFGVPVGLIGGFLFAYLAVPEGWDWGNAVATAAVVFMACYIFIMLSVWKPAKLAASVSPVEAAKATGYEAEKRTHRFSELKKVTPWRMARLFIKRNRRRFVITVLSLCVSGTIFITGTSFLTSFHELNFSRQSYMSVSEYQIWISDNAVNDHVRGLAGVQTDNPLTDKLIEKIKGMDGVETVTAMKQLSISYMAENNQRSDRFVPFSRQQEKILQLNTDCGQVDYDKAVREKQVYIIGNETAEQVLGRKFEIGEKIEVSWFDGEKECTDVFTVGAVVSDDLYHSEEGFCIVGLSGFFLVPQDTLQTMVCKDYNLNRMLMISTDWPASEKIVTAELESLVKQDDRLSLDTLRQKMQDDRQSYEAYFALILCLSSLLMLFGMITQINTIVTGILNRKQEFSMLESIGMERRQILAVIQGEGLIMAFYNTLFSLIFGGLIGWGLIRYLIKSGLSYLQYQYPIWYGIGYALLAALLPVMISLLTVKAFDKESLVERLKKRE